MQSLRFQNKIELDKRFFEDRVEDEMVKGSLHGMHLLMLVLKLVPS